MGRSWEGWRGSSNIGHEERAGLRMKTHIFGLLVHINDFKCSDLENNRRPLKDFKR